MFKQGNTLGGGRPKKSNLWKEAEEDLRKALPYMLRMTKSQLKKLMAGDPTGAEIVTHKFMMTYTLEVINKFFPSVWADETTDHAEGVDLPLQQELINQGIPNVTAH